MKREDAGVSLLTVLHAAGESACPMDWEDERRSLLMGFPNLGGQFQGVQEIRVKELSAQQIHPSGSYPCPFCSGSS